MNLKEIEQAVEKIQSHLFKNSNSFALGMLKSHFRGAGIQFKEHQVYMPGDDVRFIDWKLLAKSQTPFIKTFEEERNVEIAVVIDLTNSLFVGSNGKLKIDIAFDICFLLYLLADKTKDNVSVSIISNDIQRIPSSRGKIGIVHLLAKLQELQLYPANLSVGVKKEEGNALSRIKELKSLLAQKKQVIYMTDLEIYRGEHQEIEKVLMRSNIHCFVMESPIETGRLNSSFYVNEEGKRLFFTSDGVKGHKYFNKGKWRSLNTDERYLDSFVREMF
jgi:uncharacterized protein (DUF58 family)